MVGDPLSRVVFMVVFGFVGLLLGNYLPQSWNVGYISGPSIGALVGGAVGVAAGPYLVFLPIHWLRRRISETAPQLLLWSVVGLLTGLFAAALLALPLSLLPAAASLLLGSASRR